MSDDTVIRSRNNERIKHAAALQRRRDREERRSYLVEGRRFVADLLATGDVEEVFAVPGAVDDLVADSRRRGVRTTLVAEPVIERLAESVTPQGIVAVARQRRANLTDVVGRGFVVVLHEVSDPGNAGAAIRTAVAAGAEGVVLTSASVDPWNPKAVRASAGSVARLPLVVEVSIHDVIAACREAETRIVALDVTGGLPFDEPGLLDAPVALAFGSEAHGLAQEVLDAADSVAAIPLYGEVESLNLAATVAIVAYTAARSSAR